MEGEADFYKLFDIARIETWPISSNLICTAKKNAAVDVYSISGMKPTSVQAFLWWDTCPT